MTVLEWVLLVYCAALMALAWFNNKLAAYAMDHAREATEVCGEWRALYLKMLTRYDPDLAQDIGMRIAKLHADSALESCAPPRKRA